MTKGVSKHNKKTIYFNQDNLDIMKYLSGRKDASEYLCNLVRADLGMVKEETTVDMRLLLSELSHIKNKLDNLSVVGVPVEHSNTNTNKTDTNTSAPVQSEPIIEEMKEVVELPFSCEDMF